MKKGREKDLSAALKFVLEKESVGINAIDQLADIQIVETFAAEVAQSRIDRARRTGASWSAIAKKLGVSRQAVHKRYYRGAKRGIRLEIRAK